MLDILKKSFVIAGVAGVASVAALPAHAQIGAYEDESPIVLSGTVADISDDEFTMQYQGDNFVTVEMDDWDLFEDETNLLSIGDEVVVSGQIDDDLFEGREIEADTVYLLSDSAFFYRDQQAATPLYLMTTETQRQRTAQLQGQQGQELAQTQDQAQQMAAQEPAAGDISKVGWVSAVGEVENVEGQQFTVNAGEYSMQVDAQQLGAQINNIDVGDRVYVAGILDQGFFENREITADRIVQLSEGQKGGAQPGQMPGQQQQ